MSSLACGASILGESPWCTRQVECHGHRLPWSDSDSDKHRVKIRITNVFASQSACCKQMLAVTDSDSVLVTKGVGVRLRELLV